MKNKIFNLVFVVLVASALVPVSIAQSDFSLEYQKNVTILPRSNQTLGILIKNLAMNELNLQVSCKSNLSVKCPSKIAVGGGKIKMLLIQVETEDLGAYPIDLGINGRKERIGVRVSNTPKVLFELLDYYNITLSRLLRERGELEIQELEQARFDLGVAYKLFEEGLYHQCNEKIKNVRDGINEGATKMAEERLKIERGYLQPQNLLYQLWIPVVYLILILIGLSFSIKFLPRLKRERTVSFGPDLSKVMGLVGSFEGEFEKSFEKPKEKSQEKLDFKKIENKISSLKKNGKNVGDAELWLKFAREKQKKGQKNIANKYLERARKEI